MQRPIAGLSALLPEREGDLPILPLLRDVPGDAQEVPGIDLGGECARTLFPGEHGDRLDNRIEGVTGGCVEDLSVGVLEAEAGKGLREGGPNLWVLSRGEGLPGTLLLADALL